MLIESFSDTYQNLTLKTTFLLKWLIQAHHSTPKFILKVDDDVFVNPETLWSTLQSPPLRSAKLKLKDTNTTDVQYSIIGRMIKYGRPFRSPDSKWYLPPTQYPGSMLPRFISGPAYIFTGSLLQSLYR